MSDHLWKVIALSVGGVLGVNARYWLGHWIDSLSIHASGNPRFPWATFVVNVSGSFAIGLLTILLTRWQLHPNVKLLLITGMLGGFTTFSAYSIETLSMWERGDMSHAIAYATLSVTLALIAVTLGVVVGRVIAPENGRQTTLTTTSLGHSEGDSR